ncbi:hypothetical protein LTR47_009205 [Exophiala xenobiotica]|nr:hypothetical protein LTR41_009895 [Exophiala xenobiotica]KAK5226315.1 hypothetical protein LTR47_009205 [Exophiala xenobiotica]
MSAVEVPHQPHTRSTRRSGKKHHQSNPHDGFVSDVGASTEHQRNHSSANGNTTKNTEKGQPRKNSQAHNNVSTGRPDKARATPMKPAAYAGATFQQSPAASALPLPSFYSKSMPGADSLPTQLNDQATVNSQAVPVQVDDSPSKREATPCDFLFEAARQARGIPRGDTPAARGGNISAPNGSPAPRSPGTREGDSMFPFELDGASAAAEDGGSFSSTPYRERIEAVKSTRSTSSPGQAMDENHRKAKTEALKKLLMKSSANENNMKSVSDMNNPFNARAPPQHVSYQPQGPPPLGRHPSGSTNMYMQEQSGYNPSPMPQQMMPYHYPPAQMQTPKRPTSSRLRNVYGAQSEPEYAELSSDSAITPPISTSRKQTPQRAQQYSTGPISPPYPMQHQQHQQQQMPAHRAKPSAQQLEDDLRRVLKLDLTTRG